tara:strand:- start:429 stop:758 length:330 start_codon:yes stop_codon:yes gene_type:complete
MVLSEFNIIELSTAVATIFGACGMLLAVTQKSRCKRFKCCCGLIDCDREIIEPPLPVVEEEKIDIKIDDSVDESKTEEPVLNIPVPKITVPKIPVPKIPNKIDISQTKV